MHSDENVQKCVLRHNNNENYAKTFMLWIWQMANKPRRSATMFAPVPPQNYLPRIQWQLLNDC